MSDIEESFDDSDKYTMDIEDEDPDNLDDENAEAYEDDNYDEVEDGDLENDSIIDGDFDDTNDIKKNKKLIIKNLNEEDEDEDDNDYIDDEDLDEDDEDDDNNMDEIHDNTTLFNNKTIIVDSEINNEYIVDPNYRITSNYITIYEYSEVIGRRAEQISKGSKIFIDYNNISDPILIAKKELLAKKCPLSILRHIGLDKYECWAVNELLIK
jgi:DNA-directed RNA polymerase subunit K/omega